jgi:hypothetical protein
MKKHMFLLALLLILLVTTVAAAKSPINENIIKYRYYIKLISFFPYFDDDLTLKFEKYLSMEALKNEVEKTYKDYEESLNFIDTKDSNEIVIYDEYLKMLKEKLASNGIFPKKFDDIHYDTQRTYENVFDDFSFEFNNYESYNIEIPYIVRKTKRIFPYIYSKIHDNEKQKLLYKNFITYVNENPRDPAKDAYNNAVASMNKGYSAYNTGNTAENIVSCKAFGDSIPYWEQYLQLSGDVNSIPMMQATIKIYQGNSAVEYDTNTAKAFFEESIKIYQAMNIPDFQKKMNIWHPNAAIGEIFYRKNDIPGFIKWMNEHPQTYKANESSYFDAVGDTVILKTLVMNYEWNRLISKDFNNSQGGIKQRKSINDGIQRVEKLPAGIPLNDYKKKFVKKYKAIMNSNSVDIKIELVKGNKDGTNEVMVSKNGNPCDFVIKLAVSNGVVIPSDYSLTLSMQTEETSFEDNTVFFAENNMKFLRGNYGFVNGNNIGNTITINNFSGNKGTFKFKYTNYAGDAIKIIANVQYPFAPVESSYKIIQVWKTFVLKLYGMRDDLYPKDLKFVSSKFEKCFTSFVLDNKSNKLPYYEKMVILNKDTDECKNIKDYINLIDGSSVEIEFGQKQHEFANIIGVNQLFGYDKKNDTLESIFGFSCIHFSQYPELGLNSFFNSMIISYAKNKDQLGKSTSHELGHSFGLTHPKDDYNTPGPEKYDHEKDCIMYTGTSYVDGNFCKNCKKLIKNNSINSLENDFLFKRNKANR